MKKAYAAPEIMFEDFSLCSSIAVGCEIIVDGKSGGTCGYAYEGGGGRTLFTEAMGNSICNRAIDDDESNGFCYHVPTQANNLFNS